MVRCSRRTPGCASSARTLCDRAETEAPSSAVAQVALAWLLQRPGGGAIPIVVARNLAQLDDNLGALELQLDAAQLQRLDAVSAVAHPFPYAFVRLPMPRQLVPGGTQLRPHTPAI
ncbi:aldo/keto reductase [Xanthomonas translucens]|uniref:aldo/keto reductase n=1 Tax=Xanthomonas campestris pv. translucens TaxID=343 RepID=UPI0037DD2BED